MHTSNVLNDAKKKFFRGYMKALGCLDPQVATHLLSAQREVFLAGKEFFEAEARHAEKAMAKFEARQK